MMTSVLMAEEQMLCMKQYALDERIKYTITISQSEPTTITFPSGIDAISLANVCTEMANPKEAKQMVAMMSYMEGKNFLTVRALQQSGKAGMNVVYKGKTYIINLEIGQNAVRSVKFYESGGSFYSCDRSRKLVNSEDLLSLLDRAKLYDLMAKQRPDLTEQIESAYPMKKTEIDGISILLEQVVRFEEEDTLIFRFRLTNKTLNPYYYLPQKLSVRVGQCVYTASVSDASGIVPPSSESIGYFGITGRPNGGRANISAKSDFSLIITKAPNAYQLVPVKK